MPVVQHDWDFNLDLPYLNEGLDLFESLSLSPFEEPWKTELESLSDAWNLQDDIWNLDCKRGATMIRVHDCMWAGTCLSKDHVGRKPNQNETTLSNSSSNTTTSSSCCGSSQSSSTRCSSSPIRIPNKSSKNPQSTPLPTVSSPRSVLRKPSLPAPTKVLHRPDTPPSEDELSKTPDDDDLSWSRGVAVSEITGQRRRELTNVVIVPPAMAAANSVSFDHNYNTKKQPKLDDLGVVTPSDSEEEEEEVSEEEEESQSSEVDNDDDEDEEIDVVSLKPSSPPRKKMMERRLEDDWRSEKARKEEFRRQEMLRIEQEWRMELSRQEQAVKYASQAVSKRLTSESTKGRGRQKRKRNSSDEEDLYKPETCYKTTYRKTNIGRPRTAVRRKYNTPSKKTRISTDSETDSTEKRSQHNNMERMRRIDLRNAFDDLRNLIPSLSDATRAAKVTILRDAAAYCEQLTSNSKTLASQVSILRREQDKLRSNLSKLRRHIANKHVGSNVR